MDLLATVLEEISRGGRVCLQPFVWNQLWEMLVTQQREEPPPPKPLILAAWNFSSDSDKRIRMEEQLRWASEVGCLVQVSEFILTLEEKDWFYGN